MISNEMISIAGPAIFAGLLIALTHAPLGIEVLKRGIIFIDLAVAQIAGLGFVATGVFMHEPSPWIMQGVALTAAIFAGLFFRKVEILIPEQQEAIIGVSFVLAAALAILLLSGHPHGGEEIQHLLSGQVLFVTWQDMMFNAPIYALVLAIWFVKPELRSDVGFYFLFAIAITSSVQLVGVFVVFASLILPALAALQSHRPHIVAWACGIVSVLTGILTAIIFDAPVGPVIVVSYVLTSLTFIVFKNINNIVNAS